MTATKIIEKNEPGSDRIARPLVSFDSAGDLYCVLDRESDQQANQNVLAIEVSLEDSDQLGSLVRLHLRDRHLFY
jgi:hypothetical protein